jgi:hypothetical protein
MLRGLVKAEIARRVFNEARKPHNQAKAKELFRSVTGKGKAQGRPR